MIKRLWIKDFRNIKELTIEPSQFINLISGNNGEGKSSILYAIEYLLTDNLNEKISEYVRWGHEKFFLEMEFEINCDNYLIKVEGGKSAKKELSVNGELIYKNSEATKKLAEVIDPNIIRYSSISEQGKTAQILFDTPTNRLRKLKEILGIDKIADLCEELKQDIDKKQEEIKLNDKELKLLEEKKYNFIPIEKLEDIKDIKLKFDLLDFEKKNYDLQSIVYNTYIKDKILYDNSSMRLTEFNYEIEKFKKEIIFLESLKKEYNHIESEEELREQYSFYEKEKIQQKNIEENLMVVTENISGCEERIINFNKDLEKYQLRRIPNCEYTKEDLYDLEKKLLSYDFKKIQLEKEIRLAEEGKCSTCGKDFIIDKNIVKEKLNLCKEEISFYSDNINKIKQEITNYNNIINEQEIIKVQRQNILNNIEIVNNALEKYRKEYSSYILDIKPEKLNYDLLLKEIKNKLENRKQILEYNINLSSQIIDLKNKINTNIKLKEQYENIKEPQEISEPEIYDHFEYEFLKSEILIYDTKLQEKERLTKYNENIEKEKQEDNQRIKSLISKIDLISYKISIWKESRQVLDKDFSAWLIDKGAEYIKEKMNEFFQQVSSKYTITFSQDKNSIDFFYGDENNVSPCSMASGMEKAILAISFRVALCSLNNLNLMILDEIDSEFSEENSLKLYTTLLEVMNNCQIFCITHCEETKEMLIQPSGSKEFNIVAGEVI